MLVPRIEQGPDTISILLTTDNHVGYNENDPIRSNDGWKTFNEITTIARDRDVDMVVQAGDLFHVNKPSKKSMFQVMKSIRLNCMGDRPCELELMSDPRDNFDNGFDTINYEDPNFNISIPVFAISGNHDDATGDGNLSPLDVLSISGLLNHFGKVKDNEQITVKPVLLQKGDTKLCLYGLANIRDERLHRIFRDGHVKFQRPAIQTEQWFNIFCIHQNHAQHTPTSCIPEAYLPKFLDFVFWGHEHECIPHPVHNPDTGFDVLQAGSSIATSLSEGEVADKHVFLMNVKGTDYSLEPIRLNSVRPFILKEIQLLKTNLLPGVAYKDDLVNYLTDQVETAIEEGKQKFIENNQHLFKGIDSSAQNDKIPLPLIRLKVEYTGNYEIENARRFSNRFVGKVANVNDIIQFYKRRTKDTEIIKKAKFTDADLFEDGASSKRTTEAQLNDLMIEFLGQTELALMPEAGIQNAVSKFIENDDKHILDNYVKQEIKKETNLLLNIEVDVDEFHGGDESHAKNVFKQVLKNIKQENDKTSHNQDLIPIEEENNTRIKKNGRNRKSKEKILTSSEDEMEILTDSDEAIEKPQPIRNRKAANTRKKSKAKPTRASRSTKSKSSLHDVVMNI